MCKALDKHTFVFVTSSTTRVWIPCFLLYDIFISVWKQKVAMSVLTWLSCFTNSKLVVAYVPCCCFMGGIKCVSFHTFNNEALVKHMFRSQHELTHFTSRLLMGRHFFANHCECESCTHFGVKINIINIIKAHVFRPSNSNWYPKKIPKHAGCWLI